LIKCSETETYPEVADADLGSIGKFSITTIKKVPAPTPKTP